MNFSTYLFDFDGTLVDSMPIWTKKVLRILQKEDIKYSDDLIKTITPLGDLETAKYLKNILGVNASIDEILFLMDEFALPEYQNNIPLKKGALDYLFLLKQRGYSLNILTASPHKMLDPCLKRNGIYRMFDNVWSCDDFNKTKSNPNIYLDVISHLNVRAEDAVLFDDNIDAIRAAANAGLYTVGVYDESSEAFNNEIKQTANNYINSFFDFYDTSH